MSDPLSKDLKALTNALNAMAKEQRETNRLVRDLLELEAGDADLGDTEDGALSSKAGRIVRRT